MENLTTLSDTVEYMTCGLIHCIYCSLPLSFSLSGSSELKLKQACNLVHICLYYTLEATLSLTDPLVYPINWHVIAFTYTYNTQGDV